MHLFYKPQKLKSFLAQYSYETTIAFVPTMGNLHKGHLSLIKKARQHNDLVILSLFVNPTQFDDPQDYKHYPYTPDNDYQKARDCSVDVVFHPDKDSMYPDDYNFKIQTFAPMAQCMEGTSRPGHFDGMLTIVLKLLILIRPQKAYFSEKDYQQLILVRQLVEAFLIDTQIVACPVQREKSQLPLSSRNNKLSPEGYQKAQQFAAIIRRNESCSQIIHKLQSYQIELEYVEDHNNRRFAAVWIDGVRLIDNFDLSEIIY